MIFISLFQVEFFTNSWIHLVCTSVFEHLYQYHVLIFIYSPAALEARSLGAVQSNKFMLHLINTSLHLILSTLASEAAGKKNIGGN